MTLPVAILAGGLATRLQPITQKIPKALVEVASKPFIHHQLALLRRDHLTHVVLCVGHLGEMVQEALRDGRQWGMRLEYVFDGSPLLGTGGALRKALPLLGEKFLILYGDTYLNCDYTAVAKAFLTSGKQGLMTVFRNGNQWDRSNVLFSNNRILNYDKKSPTSDMQHIDYGLGALRADVFKNYPADTVIDLAAIYHDLVADDALAGFEVTKRFYEIGTHRGLEETRNYFKETIS
ncbi:MAG TPA: nucleotidyl transferase [Parachlamydiales bacterium]|nr:MAG: nucleotidyl transferase [Chlamydiae bacterium RIFCSPHIGHO2_12_FULL_49_32]OGN70698.1 MAG: nucleotidyl transferase [Chlamydiae bacterium RIFCSPLOWO2_12_FULL_49_12]OGN72344.1 MAG: nucleotidyl transferase [Chlamydiae bacterium RIFCSPLOWO2_02_FULL_49_12]HAZ15972.1 nucleotidyl transferase [Parachlamydiales bacterium]